ncbi:MAG: MMPL family transporter [Planctomycetaceae bacterium]|nr:MMPL family transporter [Planctomycetaceae bacterium]MCB9951267.1 MMPL family transporter [Planctomycetaceae bacterium]
MWVMVLLVFLAPLSISALRGLKLQNDVDSWLPDSDKEAKIYRWCRDQFPEQEQIVLTWDGSAVGDPRLPLFVGRLQGKVGEDGVRRGGLPYVESVVHGETLLRQMMDLGIEQDEAVRRLNGNLLGEGWLKVRLSENGREDKERTLRDLERHIESNTGLDVEFRDSARIWQPEVANEHMFEEAVDEYADFSLVNSRGDEVVEETDEVPFIEITPHDFQIRWSGMAANSQQVAVVSKLLIDYRGFATSESPDGRQMVEACFQETGSPLGMIITLSSAGVADKAGAIEAIREAAGHAFISEDALWMGGTVVAETELNNGVLRAAWDPDTTAFQWYKRSVIGISGLVGIIFALFSLKSFRLGALVVFVSYYAALLGLSIIPFTGGTMNMVLVVLPTLLMVLALSGAIHVANYWKYAVWKEPSTAVVKATEMARFPCFMAALTTSLGLISLCTSELHPVRAFGLYAAIGSIISVVMVLYGLPALLQMFPLRRVRPDEVNPRGWLRFGAFVCEHSRKIMVTCIATSVLCIVGLVWFQTETKVVSYFHPESRLARDYQNIEDSLTGITPIEIIVSFDRESQTKYRFLERMEILRDVEEQVRANPEIRGALSLASFQPVRIAPDDEASTRERIFFNRRSNETERRVKDGEVPGAASYVVEVPGDVSSEADFKWAESGAELWRITAQASALGDNTQVQLTEDLDRAVRDIVRYYPGTNHVVTGAVPLFNRTQQAVLESLIFSFTLAFITIAVVMMFVLWDPLAGGLSMIPNMLPVISIFGLVSWFGMHIDVGTMVTASVALGIAVDGTLHLLTWFRDGLAAGQSREKAVMIALQHCGPAMWQTSAAVGIGLLMLLPADLLLISRFGWLMAALIGAALLGDLLLLPAMLVGPLGAIIESRLGPKPPRKRQKEMDTPIIPTPHIAIPVVREHDRQVG